MDMMVLLLEKVPVGLRGELTRWLIQARSGVFVGRVSAQVRELLWEKVCESRGSGGAMLIYRTNTEQGFSILTDGDTSRSVVDFDGLQLIRSVDTPKKAQRKASTENVHSGQ
ncbi:MAG TPA: type I-E CRISPR-associated endoribonuclease Cas2e [Burkholderiales bacterium]|nr:type I-E CRISPR-associated endoribonuclease Cas2e [Burkholderiales bacterium]